MKKIKVLALTLVFAFAALGGAYAMWFDTLYVDATAKTGIVDLEWADLHQVDPDPNYTGYEDGDVYGTDDGHDGLDTMDPGNPNENKNIGSLTTVIKKSAREEGTGDQDKVSRYDKLQISLKNGYPGYQEYVDIKIKNVGTVPVKFEELGGKDGIPEWLLVEFRDPADTAKTVELEGYQLDPGKEIPVMIVFRVIENLESGAICPQNASANFSLTLKGVQWNEYDFDTMPDQITFPRQDNYPFPPYDN